MHADGTPDELDASEAMQAFDTLDRLKKENEKRKKEGKKDLPFPPPDCGDMPTEKPTEGEAFSHVDKNDNGKLSANEGFDAIYCLVEWGHMTEDEGFAAFEFISGFAGDDDEVDP